MEGVSKVEHLHRTIDGPVAFFNEVSLSGINHSIVLRSSDPAVELPQLLNYAMAALNEIESSKL